MRDDGNELTGSGPVLSVAHHFHAALAAERRSDWHAAARCYAEAVRLAPDDPRPAFARCLALLRAGAAGAGATVQELLGRHPAYATGWAQLGHHLADAGQPTAALVCLRRAAGAAPSAALALACGRLLRQLGRREEARTAFADACRLDPSCAPAHFLTGVAAQDERDLPAAVAAYRTALQHQPDLVEAAVNLGTALQELGDLPGAKRAYRHALRGRADTFGRVAQALTTAPRGELWLDLEHLRRDLAG